MLTGYTYKVFMQLHGKSYIGEECVNADITTAFMDTGYRCSKGNEVSQN
jgi:hypothetical protein